MIDLLFLVGSLAYEILPSEVRERPPVYPGRGSGFAATILGALAVLGVLVLVMIFVSSKPRNRRR